MGPGAAGNNNNNNLATMPLRGQNSVEFHEDGANGVGASQIEEDGWVDNNVGCSSTDPTNGGIVNGVGTIFGKN